MTKKVMVTNDKKIILIEDRTPRQKNFLDENNIELFNYENIIDNMIDEDASNILEEIKNNTADLSGYDIVICHKSVENNTIILSNLKEYCKKMKKTLVFYSGGISVNYYDNSELEYLELNSQTFYSQNLALFLEATQNEDENILMLCYGKYWKQNVIANILEKTNYILGQVEEKKINFQEFSFFVDLVKLEQIVDLDYTLEIEEKNILLSEIIRFRDILIDYFKSIDIKNVNIADKSILIHHDNVIDVDFTSDIKFSTDQDIDKYVSNYIIKELGNNEFDTIFIKDNLSSNYLELYGLRVAYHIRLSKELGDKRFCPIVIISDFDSNTLNRFSHEAKILFTQGIYLCQNTTEDIQKYQSLELKNLLNYDEFLSSVEVNPPKDTSGSHDIANKWSIYKWAEFLDVKSEVLDKNRTDIDNILYFKYLKALNTKEDAETIKIKKPTKKGKVLLIDDEWDKGWSDIITKALDTTEFDTFEYDYKDKSKFNLYMKIQNKIKNYNPDVVILDLRLAQSDHETDNIESYTGVKILEKIHEINAGIQVIMLTATSKSTILEKLYDKKILGYIKKEHPEDRSIGTVENINKFVKLIDEGLKRRYLKEVYTIMLKIKSILDIDLSLPKEQLDCEIFRSFDISKESYIPFAVKIHNEAQYVFDILDSKLNNRFVYAMLSIVSSFEALNSIFIQENRYDDDKFWDNTRVNSHKLNDKLEELYKKLGGVDTLDIENMIRQRNNYLHSNIKNIHIEPKDIVHLFDAKLKMLQMTNNEFLDNICQ